MDSIFKGFYFFLILRTNVFNFLIIIRSSLFPLFLIDKTILNNNSMLIKEKLSKYASYLSLSES